MPTDGRTTPGPLAKALLAGVGEGVGTLGLIIVLSAIAIACAGADPMAAAAAAIRQTLAGSYEIAGFVALSLPLTIVALGAAASFRGGLYNLGLEGQLIIGAAVGSIVGAHLGPFWPPLHIGLTLLAGGVAGGLVAALLGWLRVAFRVDEVLSTLLANYVVVLVAAYLAIYPFSDPKRFNGAMQKILPTAELPTLLPGTELTWGLFIVIGLAFVMYWLLQRSKLGEDWTLLGRSPTVARSAGIRVERLSLLVMTSSGFLAGLAGAFMVAATQHRYFANLAIGLGFDGILIAMVARYRVVAVFLWSLAYSWMLLAADGVEQATGIPSEFAQVIIAGVILGVAVRTGLLEILLAPLARFARLMLAARRVEAKR
jgi:simple sugar transport system permease protein